MSYTIAPIVEGHGDVAAVPCLIRMLRPDLRIATPVRFPKTKLVIPSELRRAVAIALANIPSGKLGLVLVLIDADEDCPATMGPRLLRELQTEIGGRAPHGFVALAKREYESWLVGGDPAMNEATPETAGDPKGRLKAANGGRYSETADQARLSYNIDPARLEQSSPSFARFARRIAEIPAPAPDLT